MDQLGDQAQKPFLEAYKAIMNSNFALIVGLQEFNLLMSDEGLPISGVHISKEPVFLNNQGIAYGSLFKYGEMIDQV